MVLDRKNVELGRATITNIIPMPTMGNPLMPQSLNISFDYNGRNVTFTGVNINAVSADDNAGSGLVLCENEAALLGEIRNFGAYAKNILDQHEHYEKIVEWCGGQEAKLDPVKQAEVQSAQQMAVIENRFNEIIAKQNDKIDMLTSLLQQAIGGGSNKKGKE